MEIAYGNNVGVNIGQDARQKRGGQSGECTCIVMPGMSCRGPEYWLNVGATLQETFPLSDIRDCIRMRLHIVNNSSRRRLPHSTVVPAVRLMRFCWGWVSACRTYLIQDGEIPTYLLP